MPMMCGGCGDVKEADDKIQQLCNEVKAAAEEKVGKKYERFTAKCYKKQVVAGTNYFIKVQVDGDEHVHLRVFEPLPCNPDKSLQLSGVQNSKAHADPIEYF